MVKITIDDVEFKAPEGMNLIEAAELAGIHIPNLCYLKGMKGVGACRICLVDIEGGRGPAIACNSKVKEGMVVHTKTPEILESRKFVVDLILSMHPLDCMTCTKAGICNLQKYAYEFELQDSSFQRKKFGHPVDINNPFIKMDPDYCILCGRCVRTCKEQGTNVLEFMGRGMGARISTVVDRSLHESSCTFCGSCIDACPVNSIVEYDRVRKGREWEYEKSKAVCMFCGNACDLKVYTKDQKIQKVKAGGEKGSAQKYICAYGRFGYDYLDTDSRLLTPMKRVKGELVETTWEDALKIVADKLKKSGKNTGIISVARILNETALSIKHFAEDVVKTKNYDTTVSLYADPDALLASQSGLIGDSDMIVVVGVDPSQRERVLPALNVSIRRRVARGARLVIINDKETKLDKVATLGLHGEETALIKGIIKSAIEKGMKAPKALADAVKDATITEDVEKAAAMLVDAKNPVVFSAPFLFNAASNISLLKGKVMAVTYESNAKGVAHMGLVTKGKTYKEMASQGMDVLYAIGDVPLNFKPEAEFLVVQNTHITELAKQADVLLPAATFLETTGTLIDYKGRIKHIPRLVDAPAKVFPHREILRKLAKAMGVEMPRIKEAEVKKLAKKEVKPKMRPFDRQDDLDVSPEQIVDSVSYSLLNSPRLQWLKELERHGSL
jgi:NADH dehydrogenase/NADH:ubiquinone oxidoreductase subunit G